MAVTAEADEVHRVISTAVDAPFYRAVYPELASEAVSPAQHYASVGWREGRDPAPWFSSSAYLDAYPEVRRAGVEPLYHYLTCGRAEGRQAAPSRHAEWYLSSLGWSPRAWDAGVIGAPPAVRADEAPEAEPEPDPVEARAAWERELVASEFDRAFYLASYPDVAAAGADPLDHFLTYGWREGRNPNARFSVDDYLESYPDIAHAGMNPFVHYLASGRAEGRSPRLELGFRYQVIAQLAPAEARLERALEATVRTEPQPRSKLVQGLAASRSGLKDLHLTFSHDDYTASLGGVQSCLQREGAGLAREGIDHLHLYPAIAWPLVRLAGEPGRIGVLLNGRRLGVFSPAELLEALSEALAGVTPGRRSLAIHSLLGHAEEEVIALARLIGAERGFFWLHDFASLCAGFHLLRNDVEDCGAPPPDSAACGICAYGPLRARHLGAHTRLFEALPMTVVAPSDTTLRFWKASWRFPAQAAVVLPHAALVDRGPAPVPARRRRFRVAYAGLTLPLKGWPVFKELALRFEEDPRYEFVHLGLRKDPAAPVRFRKAAVSEAEPNAMQAALEAAEPDVALVWPLCRETFSFTAYEAAAAGAAVVTGPDSGNVAAFVTETGLGRVLDNEDALFEAFESGAILELSRAARGARLYDLKYSAMTVDLLAREAAA